MKFYTYMMRNHYGEQSPAGDLAGDIKRDKDSFPRLGIGKHDEIRWYLDMQGACDACLDVFEKCWKEYEQCEKKRLKQS